MKIQKIEKKLIKGSETTTCTTFTPGGLSISLDRRGETAIIGDIKQSTNKKDVEEAINLWVGICIEQTKAKKN
jgi:hypothetical protein